MACPLCKNDRPWCDCDMRDVKIHQALEDVEAAQSRIVELEVDLAEARQREEDAVSQHDTLRDQRDAEQALADQLHEVAYACVSWENPARAAYRKARGL